MLLLVLPAPRKAPKFMPIDISHLGTSLPGPRNSVKHAITFVEFLPVKKGESVRAGIVEQREANVAPVVVTHVFAQTHFL